MAPRFCRWKHAALFGALLFVAPHARAQALEVSAGASSLLVLGPLSGQVSTAIDASVSGPVVNMFRWTAGARLGLGAWSSEAFGRFSAALSFGTFSPTAGIELGLSARADDDTANKLLSEGRASSREQLVPAYVALHAAPLRFALFERYRLSALELQIGTHFVPFGRFVRLNVQLISIGVAL